MMDSLNHPMLPGQTRCPVGFSGSDQDMVTLRGLTPEKSIDVRVMCPANAEGRLIVKLYSFGVRIALSDCLPVLERFGLKVADHRSIQYAGVGERTAWVHEFVIADDSTKPSEHGCDLLEEAVRSIWRSDSESDDFCKVTTVTSLSWREVVIFRAYSRYLRQIGFPMGSSEIAAALCRNARATLGLARLFAVLFDPDRPVERDLFVSRQRAEVLSAISIAESPDDDRILRKYLMLIEATKRTNFFQRRGDGSFAPYLALKLASTEVDGLPLPRPLYEIFVYSPRVEGIHLRGGKVARGGIRWSDRHADHRTEIHGLLKAQMVKNVVIVPEGSKGGFVVKRPPMGAKSGDHLRQEAMACYQIFIRGLLDLTDNIVDDAVVAPPGVVRRDGDDCYLVVAADKGTASFSDAANEISTEYRYWLGDAFASGGSAGYDHKKLGITARGAWVSVRRHFWEMGIDVQSQDFTVVGIGDMSGDVFGNGMLLSPRIRLIGAFDHRHIFLDPCADARRGLLERQRLFKQPQSSWADYRLTELADGGGVYERSAKSITISEAARKMLDLPDATASPNEIISALLKAPADLMWMGGIGTYIKASTEADDQVGDRANDAIRIDADQMRCRVVGEGANLGLTQRARVQFALRGGRINTDAIDNVGGVSCSDHEVNIKILLGLAIKAGRISMADRDTLLVEMSDEVAQLVLRDNYLQSQALSVAVASAPRMLDTHHRLVQNLERSGYMDREVAAMPGDDELKSRRAMGQGLTRPELSALLAYTKIAVYAEVIRSNLPDDPLFSRDLVQYFPTHLRSRFSHEIANHPLRREIITTAIVNGMVNRVGSGFINDLQEKTGCSDDEAMRAYAVVRDVFCLQRYWESVEELDGKVPGAVQIALLLEARQLVEVATLWVLRNVPSPIDVSSVARRFGESVIGVARALPQVLGCERKAAYEARLSAEMLTGVPKDLARAYAAMRDLECALDIALLGECLDRPIEEVCELYFSTQEAIGLPLLKAAAAAVPCRNPTESTAIVGVIAQLDDSFVRLMKSKGAVATHAFGRDKIIAQPSCQSSDRHQARLKTLVADLRCGQPPSMAMLVVASQELNAIAAN